MKTGLAGLGCIGLIALIPVATFLDGWALSVLWRWFIVPYLHAPVLAITPAIGVALVVRMITQENPKQADREWWEIIGGLFLKPAGAVFFGWILTFFL